jgi:hypothetical protein
VTIGLRGRLVSRLPLEKALDCFSGSLLLIGVSRANVDLNGDSYLARSLLLSRMFWDDELLLSNGTPPGPNLELLDAECDLSVKISRWAELVRALMKIGSPDSPDARYLDFILSA